MVDEAGNMNRLAMVRCDECGWFAFQTVKGKVCGTDIGEDCKYGCGPVREATDNEVDWWRDPHKTETLLERLKRVGP